MFFGWEMGYLEVERTAVALNANDTYKVQS